MSDLFLDFNNDISVIIIIIIIVVVVFVFINIRRKLTASRLYSLPDICYCFNVFALLPFRF